MTGAEEKQTALQAVRAGAEDYLCKSELEPKLLLRAIHYAIERAARRQAEEQFKDEERRYHDLLEAITSYAYSVTFDNGGTFTRHGLGCLAATGYSPDEYAADYYLWIRIVHPDDQEMVRQYVARILAGEKLPAIEHRILHKDGSTRWIRNTIIHRYDERGRLLGYDGLVEDVSQRRQAEQALREARHTSWRRRRFRHSYGRRPRHCCPVSISPGPRIPPSLPPETISIISPCLTGRSASWSATLPDTALVPPSSWPWPTHTCGP